MGKSTPKVEQPKLKDFIPARSTFGGFDITFGNLPKSTTSSTTTPSQSPFVLTNNFRTGPTFVPSGFGSGSTVSQSSGKRGEHFLVGTTPERQALINQIASGFGAQAEGLQPFIDQVRPGFGALTEAGVNAIQTARDRTLSDLRGNLSNRRLSGSSFASDALSRAEREFGDAEAAFRAEAFMQEFDTSLNLFTQQSNLNRAALDTHLEEFDKQAAIGNSLLRGISSEFGASSRAAAQTAAQLAASNAQGFGQFLGSAVGAAAALSSDRTLKEDIEEAPSVLDNIKTMPIHSWKYKGDDETRIGPMADDFNERFYDRDKGTIDIVTALGVLFKAVQELYEISTSSQRTSAEPGSSPPDTTESPRVETGIL